MPETEGVVVEAHVGVYIQGCARATPSGAAMTGLIGPFVEALADMVDRVTVAAHDPPNHPRTQDELADFVARPHRGNIDVLSLGPVGSWRDYASRRRRIRPAVARASNDWDVAIIRLPNRRADTLFAGNRCERIISIVLGYAPGVAKIVPTTLRRWLQIVNAVRTEWTQKSILRASGLTIFNSRETASHYGHVVTSPLLLPWSMRRADQEFEANDRLVGDAVNVLLCCRLTETKGVFEALAAFQRIRVRVLPHAHFHVIGDGDARAELERLVAEAGLRDAVTFHGWIPSGPGLFSLFREMDVMLHLSYAEGFPFVLWEALAHSVLVVCTPVGGIPHELRDGEEACFVPVKDVESAVRAVEVLRSRPELRRQLLWRGYERAKESSVDAVAARVVRSMSAAWPELTTRPS